MAIMWLSFWNDALSLVIILLKTINVLRTKTTIIRHHDHLILNSIMFRHIHINDFVVVLFGCFENKIIQYNEHNCKSFLAKYHYNKFRNVNVKQNENVYKNGNKRNITLFNEYQRANTYVFYRRKTDLPFRFLMVGSLFQHQKSFSATGRFYDNHEIR